MTIVLKNSGKRLLHVLHRGSLWEEREDRRAGGGYYWLNRQGTKAKQPPQRELQNTLGCIKQPDYSTAAAKKCRTSTAAQTSMKKRIRTKEKEGLNRPPPPCNPMFRLDRTSCPRPPIAHKRKKRGRKSHRHPALRDRLDAIRPIMPPCGAPSALLPRVPLLTLPTEYLVFGGAPREREGI